MSEEITKIKLKRGIGSPSSLEEGEPAINLETGDLYIGIKNNQIKRIPNAERLERLQYYGDANIVPANDNILYGNPRSKGLMLENISKTDESLVIPYTNGKNMNLAIPPSPDNYAEYIFENIKTVIFPSNILELYGGTIPVQCFPNVDTFVFSGDTGFSIGVFEGYTNLKTINIPKSNTRLIYRLFCGCTSLEKITIPDSVETIDDLAFADCISLKSIYIPDSVTSIVDIDETNESGSFYNCPNLTIVCNEGSYAEEYAKRNSISFKYDKGLSEELKIKYDTTTLQAMYNEIIEPSPEYWFLFDVETKAITGLNTEYESEYSSEDITDLVVPFQIDGVMIEKIGKSFLSRFLLSTNIKNVRLPNCIDTIKTNAFMSNPNLESINIPTSTIAIEDYAFASCSSLKEVISPIKPNWELSIGSNVFSQCSSLNNIDTIIDGVKELNQNCFMDIGVKNVIIPESVEIMRSGVFYNTILNCCTILNGNCDLSEDPFYFNNVGRYPTIIKGYKGSTADTFANEKGITFIALDEEFYSKDETYTKEEAHKHFLGINNTAVHAISADNAERDFMGNILHEHYQPKDLIIPLTVNEDGTLSTTVENVYSVIMEAINEGRNVYVSGTLEETVFLPLVGFNDNVIKFSVDGFVIDINNSNSISYTNNPFLSRRLMAEDIEGNEGYIDGPPTTKAVADYVTSKTTTTLTSAKAYTDKNKIQEFDTVVKTMNDDGTFTTYSTDDDNSMDEFCSEIMQALTNRQQVVIKLLHETGERGGAYVYLNNVTCNSKRALIVGHTAYRTLLDGYLHYDTYCLYISYYEDELSSGYSCTWMKKEDMFAFSDNTYTKTEIDELILGSWEAQV